MRSKNQCSVCPENLKKEILTGSGRRISTQIYSECQVQMVKRPTTGSSLATLHVNKMSRTSSPLALLNNGTKSTALLTEKWATASWSRSGCEAKTFSWIRNQKSKFIVHEVGSVCILFIVIYVKLTFYWFGEEGAGWFCFDCGCQELLVYLACL